ncbi:MULTISPECIES: twin-arginine translocase TatA/TatE family subunit [unclassified Microbacterium]|uniref:twin-arginine translocase TatA/TatE family subunit n=1 Tax=unclassified Microbacterium TaxID=2609290 RepID=UPI003746B6D1
MGIFGNAFSGWHLLLILAVVLLLFGAAKLPALAKSMGQSARVFRREIKDMKKDDPDPVVVDVAETRDVPRDVSNVSADAARGTTEPKA